jgi:UDP-glucuronate 4-epimerase
MRILLTGGAGFIGSHLLERLVRRGDHVTVLDDFNDYYDPAIKRSNLDEARGIGPFDLVEGDILRPDILDEAFRRARPEVVLHLAGRAGVRPSLQAPVLYHRVNVEGTLEVVDAMRRADVRRILFASSSSVYGEAPVPFREDYPDPCPLSPYGATKLAAELSLEQAHRAYGIQVTALRFFTAYGPRQRPDMAIHKFSRAILEGREIEMFGEGTTERDYTFIDDLVDGILRALAREDAFEVYNLGGSRTVALAELIRHLEAHLGLSARLRQQPEHPADPRRTWADVSKARKDLGYAPKTSLDEGLGRFVSWLVGRL